jgi:hypothetical protein
VTFDDPEYEEVGMKPRGMSKWEIRYRKKGDSGSSYVLVSRNTHHTTAGGGIEIHWP